MEIELLRHATLLVSMNGKTLLIDPMLSPAGAMPPIVNSANQRPNPLVELTCPQDFLRNIDAVLLTHMHRDHFDDAAATQLPKDKLIFCQPEDEIKLKALGFYQVTPVYKQNFWKGIIIIRTAGQHGTGEIGIAMSPVSGYILQVKGEPMLYIAGDTIYCAEVESILGTYHPQVTVVNAGAAQFLNGDPITMTKEDIGDLCRYESQTKVIAVHMEAINHCLLSREALSDFLKRESLEERVLIPLDGEKIVLSDD